MAKTDAHPSLILLAALACVNLVASLVFAVDKWQAKKNGRRISRLHLICLLWIAPFLPTVCMVLLHHKVRKRLFMISSLLSGGLHSGGLVWLFLEWPGNEDPVTMILILLMLLAVFIIPWAACLGVQLGRGCACEPSTVHEARAPPVTRV